jgi:hypothetical protein
MTPTLTPPAEALHSARKALAVAAALHRRLVAAISQAGGRI